MRADGFFGLVIAALLGLGVVYAALDSAFKRGRFNGFGKDLVGPGNFGRDEGEIGFLSQQKAHSFRALLQSVIEQIAGIRITQVEVNQEGIE